MFDQKVTVHNPVMWLLALFMYRRFLVHPWEANTKITDGGNVHHLFLHSVEGLTKQFSRD